MFISEQPHYILVAEFTFELFDALLVQIRLEIIRFLDRKVIMSEPVFLNVKYNT